MSDTDVVLWKGSIAQSLVREAPPGSPIIQNRFFLPREILVSRYGVVGMLIADNKPEHRKCSYTDSDWYMDKVINNEWDLKDENGNDYDPIRRAHFDGTPQGFSIIRAFALPSQVADVFERDKFLGEPMITKCACDHTFDLEFDEVPARLWDPIETAMPLIQTVALAGWEEAGLPHDTVKEWRQFRTWLSFHGWFAFAQAIEQGQLALQRAIGNFDSFLERVAPQVTPYASEVTRTVNTLPEKN